MKKIGFYFLIVFGLLIIFIFPIDRSMASGGEIITQEISAGYSCTVKKELDSFVWEIKDHDSQLRIVENTQNKTILDQFRKTVEDIKLQKYKLILSSLYLILLFVALLYVSIRKMEKTRKILVQPIIGLLVVTMYTVVKTWMTFIQSCHYGELLYLALNK